MFEYTNKALTKFDEVLGTNNDTMLRELNEASLNSYGFTNPSVLLNFVTMNVDAAVVGLESAILKFSNGESLSLEEIKSLDEAVANARGIKNFQNLVINEIDKDTEITSFMKRFTVSRSNNKKIKKINAYFQKLDKIVETYQKERGVYILSKIDFPQILSGLYYVHDKTPSTHERINNLRDAYLTIEEECPFLDGSTNFSLNEADETLREFIKKSVDTLAKKQITKWLKDTDYKIQK